ncbi:MAG: cytochrome b/b6 domain-containing protein [Candidatus Nitricoxidivorans perseverans]|uniref:Cytochrome b/b6 domain-containing protein n=1 Tax=Candidatus Nitricoxidivorans perseverans TaxID=2975601 RepID=A0AA49IYE4_9PROT|nr:MAG: cytochrome b/b6 domain-containing protein [Candidatus Nitricoxidivorans perseverans]
MKVRVWDLPVRLFHWLLVALVAGAFIAAKIGGNAMAWHGRIGLAILGLLVFRIVWGFTGSTYARFRQFVRGPAAVRAYLRGEWHGAGHNPLGALSVLAMLCLLCAQAATGLFANDDVAFQGYLYPLAGADISAKITGIHKLLEKALILLVLTHVGAIAFYARVKGDNLVKPMLTGWKEMPEGEDVRGGGAVAFAIAAVIAAAAVWAASGALLPAPEPPASTSIPDW